MFPGTVYQRMKRKKISIELNDRAMRAIGFKRIDHTPDPDTKK